MSKLVSILIPAYNAEKWIRDTINSALNQTWQKKEIIVVDDGSSDSTLQILREFESKLVKVVSQENRGSCAARNKALEFAQGDYIQWLDHDDILAPDKITQQLKNNSDIRDEKTLLSSAFGTFYYDINKAKFNPTSIWKDLKPIEYFLFKFNENAWFQSSAWLVSRELTEMAGPWLEVKSPDDDGEYFCRVVAVCKEIKFVPEAKSYWRIGNVSSLSRNKSDKTIRSYFNATRLCIDHLRALEDSKRTRDACLKFLQHRMIYYYPERCELLKKLNDLAQELGGSLRAPALDWKYLPIEKIFGYKAAKDFMFGALKLKLIVKKNWHKLLYDFSKNKKNFTVNDN